MSSQSQQRAGGRLFNGEDGYATRQRTRNVEYRHAYEAWVASLPPEERGQLASMGLEDPQMPDTSASGYCDAAELSRCVTQPETFEDREDSMEPEASPQFADSEAVLDVVRVILGELISQSNSKLSMECMALVTGLSYNGDSMTAIARRHNVTRAAVSKRCVEFTRALRLDPSRAMRSMKARESYRKSRNHQLSEQP
ncbi:MAG: hypothetical protein WCN98_04605 [Verrucomicrobiaceae bacterium]